jgi:hypothetical protein
MVVVEVEVLPVPGRENRNCNGMQVRVRVQGLGLDLEPEQGEVCPDVRDSGIPQPKASPHPIIHMLGPSVSMRLFLDLHEL